MAVVAVYRPRIVDSRDKRRGPGFDRVRRGDHPKMKIIPEGGDPFVVPYAPRDSELDDIVPTWATVDRGGREPLLLRAGSSLPKMSFDLVFGYADPQQSVELELAALRRLAKSGKRFRVKLDSTSAAYLWRLTGFRQTVVSRQFGSNEATRAACSLTFTAVSDTVVQVGPVSGGSKGGKKDDDDGKKRSKTYVVKKGDTLQSIAKRFYGETRFWRRIADANRIRFPRGMYVGMRLELPKVQQSELVK